jgi:hypothetical protein
MPYSFSRRQFVHWSLLSILGGGSAGCGTVLHPERRGQEAGPLDWSIVALDAVGLLFFFIPGVIAFAVDFNNGTIYLPAERSRAAQDSPAKKGLISVPVPALQRTPAALEQAIAAHTDRKISLDPDLYRVEELDHLDQFWEKHDRLAAL